MNGIMLDRKEGIGSHFVATRDISNGTIVFEEKFSFATSVRIHTETIKDENNAPFSLQHDTKKNEVEDLYSSPPTRSLAEDVSFYKSSVAYSVCSNWKCWKTVQTSKNYTCPKCHYSIFCDKKCYMAVKDLHDKICSTELMGCNLSIAALYFALNDKNKKKTVPLHKLYECGKPSESYSKRVYSYISLLQKTFPEKPVHDLLLDTVCMHFICMPMKTFIGEHPYGMGYFVLGSYFNHSCDPNSDHYFVHDKLVVRASRDIKEGEEVSISLDDGIRFLPKNTREETLVDILGKDKKCRCKRCHMGPEYEKYEIEMFDCLQRASVFDVNSRRLLEILNLLSMDSRRVNHLNKIAEFAVDFEKYISITNSLGYAMFKTHAGYMFERGMLEQGGLLLSKLFLSCWGWKKIGMNVTRLEGWAHVMYFLFAAYKSFRDSKENAREHLRVSFKKTLKTMTKNRGHRVSPLLQKLKHSTTTIGGSENKNLTYNDKVEDQDVDDWTTVPSFKYFRFDDRDLWNNLEDCHEFITKHRDWSITRLDEALYPFLTGMLQLAKDRTKLWNLKYGKPTLPTPIEHPLASFDSLPAATIKPKESETKIKDKKKKKKNKVKKTDKELGSSPHIYPAAAASEANETHTDANSTITSTSSDSLVETLSPPNVDSLKISSPKPYNTINNVWKSNRNTIAAINLQRSVSSSTDASVKDMTTDKKQESNKTIPSTSPVKTSLLPIKSQDVRTYEKEYNSQVSHEHQNKRSNTTRENRRRQENDSANHIYQKTDKQKSEQHSFAKRAADYNLLSNDTKA